jgi:hypothetical protein
MLLRVGTTVTELLAFVVLSGTVHVALLLSLTVDVRPLGPVRAAERVPLLATEP